MTKAIGVNERVSLVMSLRKKGISDIEVLRAMELVPREVFVHPAFKDQAYHDIALPINCGQTISQPYVVAYMTELLMVRKTDKVLEVGTGSGYQAAVLSHLGRRIFTIETHRDLHTAARHKFGALDLDNIVTKVGDGYQGWPEQAPFDRIIVTAAAPEVPPPLLEQLAYGGRLVMPVGDTRDSQVITIVDRTDKGFEREETLPVRFVPLVRTNEES
jgi:protein-L-isoaspartate(D-aspartate) O-methyltransferase